MANANEALFDAANRHQTFLLRYGGSTANEVVKILEEAEKDLVTRIARRVDRLGPSAKNTLGSKRLQAILADIRNQTRDLTGALYAKTRGDLIGLANQEVDIASRRLSEAVGVDLNNFRVPPETLRTLVEKRAVGGKTLRRWFTRLGSDRIGRLESAVNLGVIEGDTMAQITRRFREAEAVTKRSASTMVRTHVNHVANQSREALYAANSDIVEQVRWTSTLDGRTSQICQSRDGKTYDLDQGPRPPAHPNCRSITTPVLKSWDDLAKPGALKPGRGAADMDRLFQKNLKKQGFSSDEIKGIKRNTRASMNGQVPNDLTYSDWFKRQPAEFQNDTLGRTKAKLFRDGNLSLDKFVDPTTGRSFTLSEIKSRNEQAWMRAVGGGEPSGGELWDKNTKIGAFHEASFAKSPEYIKKQAARTPIELLPPNKDEGAFYQRSGKSLHMGVRKGEDDREWFATWAHEMGHAIDHRLGVDSNTYWSSSLRGVMDNETIALELKASKFGGYYKGKAIDESYIEGLQANAITNQKKFDSLNLEIIDKIVDRGDLPKREIQKKWAQEKLDKYGMRLKDVEEALSFDDGFEGWEKTPGIITHFITSLETRDASYLLSQVINANGSMAYKGKAIFVSDYFGGLTKNKVGWGHSNEYHEGGIQQGPTEAFANAFSLLDDTNPTWGKVLDHFTPATMKKIREKLEDV